MRRRLKITPIVAAACLLLTSAATAAAASNAAPADAVVYLPFSGAPAVVTLGGQRRTLAVPKASSAVAGAFDGSGGGGVFIYGAGAQPDGTLRVRSVGGVLRLSFRREIVNGIYLDPAVGDFDGNGISDILWVADPSAHTRGRSYLWRFQANGTHTSAPFDVGGRPGLLRGVPQVFDANSDGIDDMWWHLDYSEELWLMDSNARHTLERVPGADDTGFSSGVHGDLGPADGTHRSRLALIYEGGEERLVTFEANGSSTLRLLSPHVGTCCAYRNAVAGHFWSDQADSLFFYSPNSPRLRESGQTFDAAGNGHSVAVQQVLGTYRARVGDFDANGYDDIMWYSTSRRSYLWSGDGVRFTSAGVAGVPLRAQPYVVHLGPPG